MASPSPTPPAGGKPGGGSRWGSILSQAVAGVEARLDTILADATDEDVAKTTKQKTAAASQPQPAKAPGTTRSGSSTRVNDRLQERLARAVAAKSGAPSSSVAASPRQSLDVPQRLSSDSKGPSSAKDSLSAAPSAPADGSLRPSSESTRSATTNGETRLTDSSRPSTPLPGPGSTADDAATATTAAGTDAEAAAPPGGAHTDDTQGAPAVLDATTPTRAAEGASGYESPRPAPESETPSGPSAAVDAERLARIRQLEAALADEQQQHEEEMHHVTEKMEALQAKLQYLSREAADAAAQAVQTAAPGSLEKKLAEKEQQVAQLMEEGKNLGVTEQKHRAILKKLRGKISEDEKEITELKTARARADDELQTLRARARRVAELERAQDDTLRRLSQAQKEAAALRAEAATRDAEAADLRAQLQAANEAAAAQRRKAHEDALEKERQRLRDLDEQAATLQIEKNLAADRAKAQVDEWKAKAERAEERARATESEAQAEVQALERKLEALRVRSEEASSGALGDSQAKLLRQVETLQTQYAVASENWQGIEATLLARVARLESERDEALQRESDMRKKAREASLRAKRLEEELEEAQSRYPKVQEDVGAYETQIETLQKRAQEAETALQQAQADMETQQAAWQEERQSLQIQLQQQQQQRNGAGGGGSDINSDRRNWLDDLPTMPHSPLPPPFRNSSGSRPETPLMQPPARTWSSELLGFQGLPNKLRKVSAPSSQDDPAERFSPRRPSGQLSTRPPPGLLGTLNTSGSHNSLPMVMSPTAMTDAGATPSLASSFQQAKQQQQQQQQRLPSIVGGGSGSTADPDDDLPVRSGSGDDSVLERRQHQQHQQARQAQPDMLSVSTVAAGPSVQLVERMSAAIRRLESEKVAARDELARIAKQRNEARAEVLALIKDAEAGRTAAARVTELEAEVAAIQARYDTTLELLGEKTEMVEELRADVDDVKAMYRDLVERTVQ